MALAFKIFPEKKLVESVATGELTDEIILNHDRLLEKTEGFDPTFNHLLDFTELTKDQVTMRGLKELAENTPFNKTCRRAYITAVKAHEQRAGFLAILMSAPNENVLVTPDKIKAYNWLWESPDRDIPGGAITETGQDQSERE